MLIEIDFNSDEAFYMQIRNQVILNIAYGYLAPGETLPSVRQLAEDAGINMHTVNKAYSVLKQEGYVKIDRRRGAMIDIDYDRMKVLMELKSELRLVIAKSQCKKINREDLHALIDEIYDEKMEE